MPAAAPRRILITGASGFVGRHLTATLATAFPGAALSTDAFDVGDPNAVEAAVRAARPDVCVHLAAVSAIGEAQQTPDKAWRTNFHGTLNLAWALLRHAPDCHLLFASTADAYGATFKTGRALDETAPLAPANTYAETKAAADLMLAGMAGQGLRVVRLRPFNHVGPGQSPQFVLPAFARQIARIAAGRQAPVLRVGNLDTYRDFLDVRDVCAAYAACIRHRSELAPGTILNLASGEPRRIADVLTRLTTLAGVAIRIEVDPARVRPSDIPRACGDATQARRRTGWAPRIVWEQTLRDVLTDWRGRIGAEPND